MIKPKYNDNARRGNFGELFPTVFLIRQNEIKNGEKK
jgi:hypothetical protein